MYYYSLEKYYKKPETPTLGSPKEYLKKISSVNDVLMTESDVKGPPPKKEKGIEQTRLNKDLFKRIRVMSSDFSEAVETIFSYQLNMNSFTLAALRVVEKLLEKTNKADFTILDNKVKSPVQAAKPAKSPLEIEVNSIIHNVQRMQEELATIVNDVIPPKEKSVARGKGSRTPHSEVRILSPFNRNSESSSALETRIKSQTPSQRPVKFHKPKMKINLQKLYEQDQKENSITQMSNTIPSYRFVPTNNNSPPAKIAGDEREARKFPQTSYSKRNVVDLSHRRMESDSVVLGERKNESSQKTLSLKAGHSTIPKKEIEDDDANSQSCICITENDVPVLLPQRVKSEKAPSRQQMPNQREDSVGPIRKERTVIKDLMKAQSNSMSSLNLKKTTGGSANKRYLIDVRWWTVWKEYVNFDSNHTDESKVIIQNYRRPGMIINKDLLNQDHLNQDALEPTHIDLRDHLLEHHDFVAVSKEIFDTLAGWYSCDYEIMRMMKPHPSHPDKFYLDLFPKRKPKKK